MAKKTKKPVKKSAKKAKPAFNAADYYSKNRDMIKNAVIVILLIALITSIGYGFNSPEAQTVNDDTTSPGTQDTTPPAQPAQTTQTGEINVASLEKDIHDNINDIRTQLGFSELVWNTVLNGIARNHSIDMMENGYFSHEDLQGDGFSERYKDAGFTCMVFSGSLIFRGEENLQTGSIQGLTQEEVATMVADAWMDSFEHREKILKNYWETEGIGVAVSGNTIYVTQNFC